MKPPVFQKKNPRNIKYTSPKNSRRDILELGFCFIPNLNKQTNKKTLKMQISIKGKLPGCTVFGKSKYKPSQLTSLMGWDVRQWSKHPPKHISLEALKPLWWIIKLTLIIDRRKDWFFGAKHLVNRVGTYRKEFYAVGDILRLLVALHQKAGGHWLLLFVRGSGCLNIYYSPLLTVYHWVIKKNLKYAT